MKDIIKIKAWKIFALIIIAPMVAIILGAILAKITSGAYWTILGGLCATLTMCVTYFGWLWTAGKYLYKDCINIVRPNFKLFNYLFFGSIFLAFLILPVLKMFLTSGFDSFLRVLSLVPPLCFAICIYLIAKNLGRVEKEKFNKDHNIFVDSILIWLLPLGIWFIQPRIRKLLMPSS